MGILGIKSPKTYRNAFNDLVNWGFIRIVQRSKNNYTSNIISIASSLENKANYQDASINVEPEMVSSTISNRSVRVKNNQVDENAEVKFTDFVPTHCSPNKTLKDINSNSNSKRETEEVSELRGESFNPSDISNPEPEQEVTFPRHKRIIPQREETVEEETITSPDTTDIPDELPIDERYLSIGRVCEELGYGCNDDTIATLLGLGSVEEIIHILKKTREGDYFKNTNHLSGIKRNWKELSKAYPYSPVPRASGRTIPAARIVSQEWKELEGTRVGGKYREQIEFFNSYSIPFHYDEVKRLSDYKHRDIVPFIEGLAETYPDELEKLKTLPPEKSITELLNLLKQCSN